MKRRSTPLIKYFISTICPRRKRPRQGTEMGWANRPISAIVLRRTILSPPGAKKSRPLSVPWSKTKLATDLSKKFARHTANARKTKEKLKVALDSLNDLNGTILGTVILVYDRVRKGAEKVFLEKSRTSTIKAIIFRTWV